MVKLDGTKMSKSLGNLVFISDLRQKADPRAIRLALLHRLVAAAARPDGPDPAPFAARVRNAIDDDLDAPRALDALGELADAILSGGTDPTAPAVLTVLAALIGGDITRPI
jgi:L-cysteine:1D-myo-inositol 2-amino-2-deoxy-alpha-D-glucopyranoside ligase